MKYSKKVSEFITSEIGEGNKEIGEMKYSFLASYFNFSIESRLVVADAILTDYKKLESINPKDEKEEKDVVNRKTYYCTDLLTKVMFYIEDLICVLVALEGDLKDFHSNLLGVRKYQDLLDKYINAEEEIFYKILTYPKIESLPMKELDKDFLKDIYSRNIRVIKKLLNKIKDFVKHHNYIFRKYKHGYASSIRLPSNLTEGIDYVIPIIDDKNIAKAKLSLSGRLIIDRYFLLMESIVNLIRDLGRARLHMIECAGIKIPLLNTYIETTEEEKKKIEEINEKVTIGVKRPKINTTIKVNSSQEKIEELLEYFNKGWWFDDK